MPETVKSQSRFPGWAHGLAFGLCLLPPLALAVLLRRNAVNVPYWDEWDDDLAGIFLKWHAGTLSFGDFWAQHTESRLVLPRLIFLLLGNLSHWNLCWQMTTTFLLVGGAALAIGWLGRKTLAEHPVTGWLACFIASLLLFSPAQSQAWLWGLEMILYLPLCFILASLLVLRTKLAWQTKLLYCAVMATASTYSFSNGLLAWPALFPILFLTKGWHGLRQKSRAALLWLFAFLANAGWYFQDYQFPTTPGLWQVLCAQPLLVLEYLCAFLGGPLANQNSGQETPIAMVVGGSQFVLFFAIGVAVFHRRKHVALMSRVWPWLTLGGYAVLSALLATAGRAAFGPAQALASRYGIFGICLTVALVCLATILVFYPSAPAGTRRPAGLTFRLIPALLGATVIALYALALPAAVVNLKVFSYDLRHAKTCLKFLDALPPQPATTALLCPDYHRVKCMADALNQAGVWNFFLFQTRRLADFQTDQASAGTSGSIENSQVSGGQLVMSGWAFAPARHVPADCVLFTCEGAGVEPQIFALMDRRFVRADLVKQFQDSAFLLAGWEKTCPLSDLPKGTLTVKAWSYDLETDRLTPLAGEVTLINR